MLNETELPLDDGHEDRTMQKPGALLKAARVAKKISQVDIAAALRVSESVIKRIDDDNYDENLPLVYLRGYLGSYAKCVQLDEEKIFSAFNHLFLDKKDLHKNVLISTTSVSFFSVDAIEKISKPLIYWGSAALVLIMILLVTLWWSDQNTKNSAIKASLLLNETTIPENQKAFPTDDSAVNETGSDEK